MGRQSSQADRGAIPEVCGDAALLVDPTDEAELAAALAAVLSDEDLRRELARRGLERASGFSWSYSAERTLAVYAEVLERGRLELAMVEPQPGRLTVPVDDAQTPCLVPRTLVVTGHFPPTVGGIQTFTLELLSRLPAEQLVVIAPECVGSREVDAKLDFSVLRRCGSLLLRDVRRVVREHGCEVA